MNKQIIDIEALSAVQGGSLEVLNFGNEGFVFKYGKGSDSKFSEDCSFLMNYERTYPGVLDAFKAKVTADAKNHIGSAEDIEYGKKLGDAATEGMRIIREMEKGVYKG
ncbi:MAG: hypothetical protein WCV63_10935 [Negativicutes bacterium]|jgi:hypothetical protein